MKQPFLFLLTGLIAFTLPLIKAGAQALSYTPEWTSSANGILNTILTTQTLQVQSLYGYTVSGLGDVNNDGYDDVAVSAPGTANVVAGNGSLLSTGAVMVYFGSAAGLAANPNCTLQPASAAAGALFGFSVAGGDVTGDGINDIIIGAPMDMATIPAGSGRVGRVYVYAGSSSLTGTPAPLLSLTLPAAQLTAATIAINALLGFSVAVTPDMNGDGKGEIVAGAPTYARVSGSANIKTGGAFLFLSNSTNSFTTVRSLNPPTGSVLGLESVVSGLLGSFAYSLLQSVLGPLLNGQISGLLFGYSVDGIADYTGDGIADIVVGAPAGVNLGSLNSLLNGQILGGSAYIFPGLNNSSGVNTSAATRLQAGTGSLLGNAGNLFGYVVKGSRNAAGTGNGNILVGAPVGNVLSNITGGLRVQAGSISVFVKPGSGANSLKTPDQTLASPRSSSVLSLLSGQNLQLSMMYGASVDNMLDINCDNIGDIIVGEPLSTRVNLLNADLLGGAAYVYTGNANGTYNSQPEVTVATVIGSQIGLNAAGLLGYSVAGARRVWGPGKTPKALVGAPGNALDFSSGLLNLGNTLSVLQSFTFDNNGIGKAFLFNFNGCVLNANQLNFTAVWKQGTVPLKWTISSGQLADYILVERSSDGKDFSVIGQLDGKLNALTDNDYSFLDDNPLSGTGYYRLQIADPQGIIRYSSILTVRSERINKTAIQVSPNPIRNEFKLSTQVSPGSYTLEITNAGGKLVKRHQVVINQDKQSVFMQTDPGWGKGLFILRLTSGKEQHVVKISIL